MVKMIAAKPRRKNQLAPSATTGLKHREQQLEVTPPRVQIYMDKPPLAEQSARILTHENVCHNPPKRG